MTDDLAERPSKRRIGPYELIREAGRGGMSTVYEAVDSRDGRTVAVKVLAVTPHLPEEEQQKHLLRFQREADALAHLDHPNLVSVLDRGSVWNTPETPVHYLVLEYVAGETLAERLARTSPLPLGETTAIIRQVAGVLDAAHAAGVVHRDVKPSNIMIQPDGTARLMDFGVACLTDETNVTHPGTIIGSPAYMSPEQARGEPVTAASDQWSLAAVLYAMLVGRSPFVAENVPATLYQVTHGVAGPIPDVPPAVMRVFARAFDQDPGQRYSSSTALVTAFREALVRRTPAIYSVARPPASVSNTQQNSRERQQAALLTWLPLATVALLIGFLFAATLKQKRQSDLIAAVPTPRAAPGKSPAPPGPRRERAARKRTERKQAAAMATATKNPSNSTFKAVSRTPVKRQEIPRLPLAPTARPSAAPSLVALIVETKPVATPRPRALLPASAPALPKLDTVTSALQPALAVASPTPAAYAVKTEETLPETSAAEPASDENLSFLGTWRGTHSGVPAMLVIKKQNAESDAFEGVLTVQTAGGAVAIAVKGRLYDDQGRPEVVLEEQRVIAPSTPRTWDLGTNTGLLTGPDTMSGSGHDRRGRIYSWSFNR